MTRVLQAEGISAGYGGVEIVHEMSLAVEAGEIVTIIGPNGAGKSTFLKSIFGILRPQAGRVLLQDVDVTDYSAPRMVAAGASFVPQTSNVFASLSVRENLEMGGYRRGRDLGARVQAVLGMFPVLAERPREKASRLSGGQRQTLAIARALMLDPVLLILDEPTASLAPVVRTEIFERVVSIRDQGVAVLLVEQNASEALAISDRGAVMVSGQKELEQGGQEMLNNREVGRLFLGQAPAGEDAADPVPANGER